MLEEMYEENKQRNDVTITNEQACVSFMKEVSELRLGEKSVSIFHRPVKQDELIPPLKIFDPEQDGEGGRGPAGKVAADELPVRLPTTTTFILGAQSSLDTKGSGAKGDGGVT